jgi:hypothetical protein
MVAACVLTFAWFPSSSRAQDTPGLTWTTPFVLGPPVSARHGLQALSCPSASMCVALGEHEIVASTDLEGGHGTWIKTSFEEAGPMQGVACPSTSLCVAVDEDQVLTSTDLGAGADTWKATDVSRPGGAVPGWSLQGVACSSVSLCVAIDNSGEVLTSSDPTGGASAWTFQDVDATANLTAVSCASSSLCAAVDVNGNVLTSTNPAGGAASWSVSHIITSESGALGAFLGVSCPATTMCLALGAMGDLFTSTDPTGGAAAWNHTATLDLDSSGSPPALTASTLLAPRARVASAGDGQAAAGQNVLSCPSTSLCVIPRYQDPGGVFTSLNPIGGEWTFAEVDASKGPTAVSCSSASACVLADSEGFVLTSSSAAGGMWTVPVQANAATEPPAGIMCVARSLCVAADSQGLFTGDRPAGGARAWTRAVQFGLSVVACHGTYLCVAGTPGGSFFWSTNPSGGPKSWPSGGPGPADVEAMSCPSVSRCLAVTRSGRVAFIQINHGQWNASQTATVDSVGLDGIACPSLSLCVAADSAGNVLISTHPAATPHSWHVIHLTGATKLDSVSCPSTTFCAVAGEDGYIATSEDPAGGAAAWHVTSIESIGRADITGVSCPTSAFCVAVDAVGQAVSSDEPAGGANTWQSSAINHAERLTGVSCTPGVLCVATGEGDHFIVGQGTETAVSGPPLSGALSVSGLAAGKPRLRLVLRVQQSDTQQVRAVTIRPPSGLKLRAGRRRLRDLISIKGARRSAITIQAGGLAIAAPRSGGTITVTIRPPALEEASGLLRKIRGIKRQQSGRRVKLVAHVEAHLTGHGGTKMVAVTDEVD